MRSENPRYAYEKQPGLGFMRTEPPKKRSKHIPGKPCRTPQTETLCGRAGSPSHAGMRDRKHEFRFYLQNQTTRNQPLTRRCTPSWSGVHRRTIETPRGSRKVVTLHSEAKWSTGYIMAPFVGKRLIQGCATQSMPSTLVLRDESCSPTLKAPRLF